MAVRPPDDRLGRQIVGTTISKTTSHSEGAVMHYDITQTDEASDLPLPHYQSLGAAGIDLYAAETFDLSERPAISVKTGVKMRIPNGYCGMIRSRSGLAFRYGIAAMHGTIDSDYRGEIAVLMYRLWIGDPPPMIDRGTRIAQLIFVRTEYGIPKTVEKLHPSSRGEQGFGSTGLVG
jgi:dUTP pyrophosphatase